MRILGFFKFTLFKKKNPWQFPGFPGSRHPVESWNFIKHQCIWILTFLEQIYELWSIYVRYIYKTSFSAKSPLFSHINATLNGLPTIRSSGAGIEKMMRNKFDVLQDTHSGAWYQVLACGTVFGIVLDTITCLFIACLCYSFILISETGA